MRSLDPIKNSRLRKRAIGLLGSVILLHQSIQVRPDCPLFYTIINWKTTFSRSGVAFCLRRDLPLTVSGQSLVPGPLFYERNGPSRIFFVASEEILTVI